MEDIKLRSDIEKSLDALSIPIRIAPNSSTIIEHIESRFGCTNLRAWWEGFSSKAKQSISCSDGNGLLLLHEIVQENVSKYFDENELLFFIAESNTPVFLLSLKEIVALIGEMYYFEYYIIPSSLDWIVCENDHNEIIFSDNHLKINSSN